MYQYKEDFLKFLIWMRNGTAFCTTWFLILILVYNLIYDIPFISTNLLVKVIFLSTGGVFLFNLFFTCLFVRRWSFLKRLTGFMIAISLYECFCFYLLEFFHKNGTTFQWILFVGIVLVLYFCCIGIYQIYSKKQGELYTESLKTYQKERQIENNQNH